VSRVVQVRPELVRQVLQEVITEPAWCATEIDESLSKDLDSYLQEHVIVMDDDADPAPELVSDIQSPDPVHVLAEMPNRARGTCVCFSSSSIKTPVVYLDNTPVLYLVKTGCFRIGLYMGLYR
jgi:hypothetical protein